MASLITEKRGGWDEWSDEYQAVLGLKLEDGTVFEERFIENEFVDSEGRDLVVELPMRKEIGSEITIERYDDEDGYEYYSVTSVGEFEEILDVEDMALALENL